MGQAPKELTPYASARNFFGAELRLWRERCGMSQDQLGARVHVSGDLVGRVEKAQRRPPPGFAECCDEALGTGGVLARLWPLLMIDRGARVAEGGVNEHADNLTGGAVEVDSRGIIDTLVTGRTDQSELRDGRGDAEEAEVRRSEFLGVTGAALLGVLAPPLVPTWPDVGRRLAEFDLDSLALAQFRAQTEGLRWLDRREGSLRHLPAGARHASQLVKLWRETRADHPLRVELAGIAGDTCHLVAYQMFDQGEPGRAMDWYRTAAELAAAAADKDLYVFAMCGVAFMYAEQANAEPLLAHAVLDQLGSLRLTSAAAGYVETYRAYSHAAERDLSVARRALDRAELRAGRADTKTPSSWLGVPDGAWIARQHAIILSRFGQPEALAILDRLGAATPAVFRRYRITMTCDRALTHAHLGDADLAADLLVHALQLNRHTRSVEKHRRILAARRVLGGAAGSAEVRALDGAIAALAPHTYGTPEVSRARI